MRDLLNDIAYRTRSTLRWSPRPPRTSPLELTMIRADLSKEGRKRFDALQRKMDIEPLRKARHLSQAREGLWALDVLDQFMPKDLPWGRALDVGAKNGALIPGLATAFPRAWDSIELDAHRRYANFTTRRAHGEVLAARFSGCRFIAGNVLDLKGRYSIITWFLPFVVESPLTAWGLPKRFFAPKELLAHVVSLLDDNGALFIVNQEEEEARVQQRLLDEIGCAATALGVLPDRLSPYRHQRLGFVVRGARREASAPR